MKTITYREIKDFINNNPTIDDDATIDVSEAFLKQLYSLSNCAICKSYHEVVHSEPRYNTYTGGVSHYVDVVHGVCYGTKEQEECSCCGNVNNCTHYPEKRNDVLGQ